MRAKRRLIPDKQSIAAQPQRARGSALASHLPIAQTPPSHPGQILLADVLEPLGLTQTEAARRLGIPLNRLNEIVSGKRGITPDTAIRLASVFDHAPAERWLALQGQWDLHRARSHAAVQLFEEVQRAVGLLQNANPAGSVAESNRLTAAINALKARGLTSTDQLPAAERHEYEQLFGHAKQVQQQISALTAAVTAETERLYRLSAELARLGVPAETTQDVK
jgi:addiction module HigA family antidote